MRKSHQLALSCYNRNFRCSWPPKLGSPQCVKQSLAGMQGCAFEELDQESSCSAGRGMPRCLGWQSAAHTSETRILGGWCWALMACPGSTTGPQIMTSTPSSRWLSRLHLNKNPRPLGNASFDCCLFLVSFAAVQILCDTAPHVGMLQKLMSPLGLDESLSQPAIEKPGYAEHLCIQPLPHHLTAAHGWTSIAYLLLCHL